MEISDVQMDRKAEYSPFFREMKSQDLPPNPFTVSKTGEAGNPSSVASRAQFQYLRSQFQYCTQRSRIRGFGSHGMASLYPHSSVKEVCHKDM